jgi:hypothetical protein
MRVLLVGGTFDHNGGKASKIIAELSEHLALNVKVTINGGSLDFLHQVLDVHLYGTDVLLWFPNIDNVEDKILPELKKRNPKLLLVQSKRAVERDYTPSDMIGRMLQSHSNLGVLMDMPADRLRFRVLDPLGNLWGETEDVRELANTLSNRISVIMEMKRVGSTMLGQRRPFHIDPKFIEIVRNYGTEFTKFVNAVNPNRLLGNASTRCAKGFPGIRTENRIFVTRRNVDKQTLSEDDFVEINTAAYERVGYYGDNKPSVDTPVQMRLFGYYANVNYMLHGHVYVEGGSLTGGKTPCGYLDEFDEIVKLFPDPESTNFVVNLRGHGCLIMARDLDFFANQTLKGRPFPET